MNKTIYLFVLFLLFQYSFSLDRTLYIFNLFDKSGDVSNDVYDFTTNEIAVDLQNNNYYSIDTNISGSESQKPELLLTGTISYYEDKYTIYIRFSSYTNSDRFWEDEVYTYDIWSQEGLKNCINILTDRILRKISNRYVMNYREIKDYKKIHGRISGNNKDIPTGVEIVNLINIQMSYPYGFLFDFPLAFGIDFFQYGMVLMIPNFPIGLGICTEAFNILGPKAGTVLPIQLLIPIYIFPDQYDYNRKDFYLYADWGFLFPQYAYLNLGIKIIFSGLSLSLGWLYLPSASAENYSRNELSTIFGRVTLSFGKYIVNWK